MPNLQTVIQLFGTLNNGLKRNTKTDEDRETIQLLLMSHFVL
jgi:hypothetical protein